MADNLGYTPGTGALVATDDVGGVQFQKLKLDIGGDGVSTPLVAGSAASASCLPVVIASDQAAFAVNARAFDGAGTAITSTAASGKQRLDVTLASAATVGTAAGTAANLVGGTDGTNAQMLLTDVSGRLIVNVNSAVQIGDGTNSAAIKAPSTAAVASDRALVVALSPNNSIVNISSPSATNGGHATAFTALSLAATTVTQIKASNANIGSISIAHNGAGTRWVKVFLLPSASVTMGTTNCSLNYRLATGESRDITFSQGFRSSAAPNTGLSYAITSGQGLNDNTSTGLAIGDVEITVVYT
jgi:hypothetical protein